MDASCRARGVSRTPRRSSACVMASCSAAQLSHHPVMASSRATPPARQVAPWGLTTTTSTRASSPPFTAPTSTTYRHATPGGQAQSGHRQGLRTRVQSTSSSGAATASTMLTSASPKAPSAASAPAAAAAAAAAATAPAAEPAAVRDDFATDQRPVILFDGVCNLCNGGVNFMLDNDPRGVYRLAALQSPAGRRLLARCGRSPDDISSIVLVERDRHFIRSEAILRIGAGLRIPLPLLAAFGFPVPLPLRDAFYDAVANNRYSFFGRTDACRLRDAGSYADRFIVD